MNRTKKLLHLIVIVCATIFIQQAYADDRQDIKQLIQNLYSEDAKALLCSDPNGEQNEQLIAVSGRYISSDFMKYFKQVCLNHPSVWLKDIRTGQAGLFSYDDSKAEFTSLNIEQPRIKGKQARIRTTYDLPVASYKEYGNFTVFKLIKENDQWKIDDIELGGHDYDENNEREVMTGLQVIKSLKQYLKKGLEEAAAEKKATEKE